MGSLIDTTHKVARIAIHNDADVILACQKGRQLASQIGLSITQQAVVSIAISEVARNILNYAGEGSIVIEKVAEGARAGLEIQAQDQGPGIADINLALKDGYSTGKGLGLGLPGARRLMDEFEIFSEVGKGTTVVMKKWTQ